MDMAFKRFLTLAVLTVLYFTGLPSAHAIDVSPMVMRITPSGSNSSYRLSVRNTDDQPVTVELQVFRMEVDVNGNRTLTEELNDLAIFPPQSIIPPNREQVVQVRFVGQPDAIGMYLVRVGQLPITFSSDGASPRGAAVQVAFNVNTHVLVAPVDAKSDLNIASTRLEANGDLLIVAENRGAGFASLRQAKYTVTSADGRTKAIPPEAVRLGQVSILPGGATRNIHIPAALLTDLGADLSASVDLS
jgi:fimbrial chaperone protein